MKKISFLVISIFLAIALISCYPRYTIIPLPDIDNPIDTRFKSLKKLSVIQKMGIPLMLMLIFLKKNSSNFH